MLDSFTRALTYYLGGGFALALFCALWYLDRPADLDEASQRRLRRRAAILTPLGLLHPMVALTAVGLARDAARDGDPINARPVLVAATCSLVASLGGMAGVLLASD